MCYHNIRTEQQTPYLYNLYVFQNIGLYRTLFKDGLKRSARSDYKTIYLLNYVYISDTIDL